MSKRILGLDLGTNSIGWAVVEKDDGKFSLVDKGVRIFQEGATAKERTSYRGTRRLYYRRRLRKIKTLRLLSTNEFCPPFSNSELKKWMSHKKFPIENEEFRNWLKTDNQDYSNNVNGKQNRRNAIKNPYYYRNMAVNQKISKYDVGRAIYHIAQRRGFLSNSLSKESDELIVIVAEKIKELLKTTDELRLIKEGLSTIKTTLDDDVRKDKKIKKLFKDIEKLTDEDYINKLENLLNKRENLGVVKAGIQQLTDEIKTSGKNYLGEYFYFLYESHQNLKNEKAQKKFFEFKYYFKKKYPNEHLELSNKIRTRYVHREKHYLAEFKKICTIQGLDKIEWVDKKKQKFNLAEELENAIFFVRPLKSQKGAVGKCTQEKNKPRCYLSHPTYEEYRMWQFINNIRYRKRDDVNGEFGEFIHLSYGDKIKIAPLFYKSSNFKFNEIIKKIDPNWNNEGLNIYEFSHQKVYEKENKKSLTVEASHTIYWLQRIFKEEWKSLSDKSRIFKYKSDAKAKKGLNPECKVDIYEIWRLLVISKMTKNHKDYLKDFAVDKLFANDNLSKKLDEGEKEKHADWFQELPNKLKEGYASLSLNAIRKILYWMKPKDENSKTFIYSHATFFANIEAVIGKDLWIRNQDQILEDLIEKFKLNEKQNYKNALINKAIKGFFDLKPEDRFYPNINYVLHESDKKHIEKKASDLYGTNTWKEKTQLEKDELLHHAYKGYNIFLSKVKINGNRKEYFISSPRKDEIVKKYLKESFLDKKSDNDLLAFHNGTKELKRKDLINNQLKKLYHPSDVDFYPKAKFIDGKLKMPSPYLPDIKNPVANRTLHKLKELIEALHDDNVIDTDTHVHIEVAKEINGENMRRAISNFQVQRQNENDHYRNLLSEFKKKDTIDNKELLTLWKNQLDKETEIEVNEDFSNLLKLVEKRDTPKRSLNSNEVRELDIIKRRLWEEQKGICFYSGNPISISQLFDDGVIQIEHTFPRSRFPDNSLENKTLAFTRENQEKGNQIPYEMKKYEDVLIRVKTCWKKKIDNLKDKYNDALFRANNGTFSTPDKHNAAIQHKFLLQMQLEYWTNKNGSGKFDRFTANEITKRFKNSQLNDTRIITKYAGKFLESFFDKKPFFFQGSLVATFRKEWGIQSFDEKKERSKHCHHTIDAITIACMTYRYREILLKNYYKKKELGSNLNLKEPFADFSQNIKTKLEQEVLVENVTKDKSSKQNLKKSRHRGHILKKVDYKKDKDGNILKDKRNNKIIARFYYQFKKGRNLSYNEIKQRQFQENIDYFVVKDKKNWEYYYEFVYDNDGNKLKEKVPVVSKGNSVREQIHEATFYGATRKAIWEDGKIQKDELGQIAVEKNKDGSDLMHYVIRKELKYDSSGISGFKNIADLKSRNIVDPVVKEMLIVQSQQAESFSKAFENGFYMLKPLRRNKSVTKDEQGRTVFITKEDGNFVKGPQIKSVRIFSKLKEPIKLKKQTFESEAGKQYKEYYYVNNKNNALYVVYENIHKPGQYKAVVSSLFECVKLQKEKTHQDDKPYPRSIKVLINKNKIEHKVLKRNGKDVVLRKGLHIIFRDENCNDLDTLFTSDNKKVFNRLYKIETLNQNFFYAPLKECYVRSGEGQIKLRHHMMSKEVNKNSEIEDFEEIYNRFFGDGKMPESVTEFKPDYPFPFLLMSLNKMNMFIEGIDFKILPLGRITKI